MWLKILNNLWESSTNLGVTPARDFLRLLGRRATAKASQHSSNKSQGRWPLVLSSSYATMKWGSSLWCARWSWWRTGQLWRRRWEGRGCQCGWKRFPSNCSWAGLIFFSITSIHKVKRRPFLLNKWFWCEYTYILWLFLIKDVFLLSYIIIEMASQKGFDKAYCEDFQSDLSI